MNVGELFARLTLDDAQFRAGMSAASASMNAATGAAAGLSSALSMVATSAAIAGAAMAAGFGAAVVAGVSTAASMQQVQLGFEALLGSAGAATDEIAKLNAMAAATPFEFKDLVKGSSQLLAAGQALNMTADGARSLLAAVGDRVSLMGGGAEEIKRTNVALTQMMMNGKVKSQEMNQLTEALIDPWQRLSAELGVSTAETRKMVESGLVPAATMMKAIVNQPGKALGAMQAQSQTLIGLFSTLKDVVGQGLGKAAQPLVESLTAAMPAVTAFAGTLIAAMDPLIRGMGEVAGYAVALLADFNALNPTIKQFALYAAAIGVVAVGGIASIGVALLSLVPTIAAVATAFLTLDAAALPFLVVGAAIVASILLIDAVIAETMAVAVVAIGSVVAAGSALYAAWSADFAGIANVIKGVASTLYDLAANAIGAVYDAFLGLDPAIGGVIGQIGELVDSAVSAGKSIYDALSGAFSSKGILSALSSIKDAMIDAAISVLSSLNAMISGALPMLIKFGAGASAIGTQGAILSSQAQLSGMKGAIEMPDFGILGDATEAAAASIGDYRGALDGLTMTTQENDAAGKAHEKAMKAAEKAAHDFGAALVDAMPKKGESQAVNFGLFDLTGLEGGVRTEVERVVGQLDPLYAMFQQMTADGTMTADSLSFFEDVIKQSAQIQETYNKQQEETILAARKAGDAMGEAIAKMASDLDEARKAMTKGIGTVAMGVVGGMSKMGELIDAAKSGAEMGGVVGAIVAVIGKLLSWNGKFQESMDQLDKVIDGVVGALDGLVEGLNPLSVAVGNIITVVLDALVPIFDWLGDILKMLSPILETIGRLLTVLAGLFEFVAGVLNIVSPILYAAFDVIDVVLRGIAIVILGIAYGLETAYNWVVEAIADVLDAFGANKAADKMRSNKADAQGTLDQINELISTSYEDALAAQGAMEFHSGTDRVQQSANGAADALDSMTESLSNIPSGFKLAQYIYDAANGMAQSRSVGVGTVGSGNSTGGTVVNIGTVVSSATDAADLFAAVQSQAKKASVVKRYSPATTMGKWGTA